MFASSVDMGTHQRLGEFTVSGAQSPGDLPMLVERHLLALGHRARFAPVHAQQMIKVAAECAVDHRVLAAFNQSRMEVEGIDCLRA